MLAKFLRCRGVTAIALVLVLGMIAARIGVVHWGIWLCAALAAFVGTACWRGIGRFALLLIGFMSLGGFLMTSAMKMPALPEETSCEISGYLAEDAVYQSEQERAVLTVAGTELGKIRLYADGEAELFEEMQVGDRITAQGRIWLTAPAQMRSTLWKQGISACVFTSEIASEAGGFSFGRVLSQTRGVISERIKELFPRSYPLVEALVLGDREELAEEQTQNFSRAGVSHLLAVSGLHVSLIAAMLDWVLRKLRIPGGIVFAIMAAALAMYAVLVGMRASVIRAVLMYVFSGLARQMGRPRDGLASMSASAVVQLIANPLWLTDAGFILSYSAVAGIMMISAPMTAWVEKHVRIRPLRWAVNMLLVSYGAVVGTLPGVVAIYGWVASYGILLNLAAIPLTTFAMYGCITALLVSIFFLPAGAVIGFAPDLLLKLLDMLAAWAADLPGNAIALRPWTVSYIILFAAVAAVGSRYLRVSRKWAMAAVVLLPVMLVAYETGMHILSRTEVKVVFLDVGQADAAAIHAQGELYFVDVGEEFSSADTYAMHNGGRVSGIFLSHPHSDHAGGLISILEDARVDRIYIPAGWDTCDQDAVVVEAMDMARDAGVEICTLSTGDVVRLSEDVSAEVFAPDWDFAASDANAVSMVLMVEYGKTGVLFTGDLPSKNEMLDVPDIDVLKVAHHGAAGATSMRFLYEATPSLSVISVGRNSYGHPSDKTLERLAKTGGMICRTDQNGNIEVYLMKDGYLKVSMEKEAEP